jgi:hypothetical protein
VADVGVEAAAGCWDRDICPDTDYKDRREGRTLRELLDYLKYRDERGLS